MTNLQLDDWLVVLALIMAVVLVIFASATAGRKLADRDILLIRHINGIRLIEITIKLRAQANRVVLGLVFGFISVLVIADAPASLTRPAFRIGIIVVLLSFAVSSVLDWVDDRRQLRLAASGPEGGRLTDAPLPDRTTAAVSEGVSDHDNRPVQPMR